MTDDFIRLPTQAGDLYIRPSAIVLVRDQGMTCQVQTSVSSFVQIIEVTIDAAAVMAILRGETSQEQS